MKEFLFILLVILIILALVAFRYRRQIMTAVNIWRMFRNMRQMNKPAGSERKIKSPAATEDVQLVRCARCGSWKPQSEALKFSRGTFYCSANCVNEAMNVR